MPGVGTVKPAVGFTGTRRGMTEFQAATLKRWLRHTAPLFFHHGDCIGADAEAHQIAADLGIEIELHPPINPKYRAFCTKGVSRYHPEREYHARNKNIMQAAMGCNPFSIFAAPETYDEVLRSGTWSAIRFAKTIRKRVCVIWPDGSWSDWKEEKNTHESVP